MLKYKVLFVIFLMLILTSQSFESTEVDSADIHNSVVYVNTSGIVTYLDNFNQKRPMRTGLYALSTYIIVGRSSNSAADSGERGAILIQSEFGDKVFITSEQEKGRLPGIPEHHQVEGTLYDFIFNKDSL